MADDPTKLWPEIAADALDECNELREQIERLREECDALRALLAEARGALLEVRAHLHAAGRRPETCHEMSVIDDALRSGR